MQGIEERSSMNDKTREIPVGENFLRGFMRPLWDGLGLWHCEPLSAIEGVQEGFPFTIIEIRHDEFGRGQHGKSETTFFVVRVPKATERRMITWRPDGYDVLFARDLVYLAQPGMKARPKDWRQLIQLTIEVAKSLNEVPADLVSRPLPRTYTPVGPTTITIVLGVILFIVVTIIEVL